MNVLVYHWDHIEGTLGGGVSLYVRNLIKELVKKPNLRIFYLNSGLTYTKDCKIRMVSVKQSFDERIQAFEIVNSPFVAPVRLSGRNLNFALKDQKVKIIFEQFIAKHKIDVVHYNNLEGLPIQAIQLKSKYPHVKFIYSVHNYFPLCSRTNLWKDEKKGTGHNCDKKNYLECSNCYIQRSYTLEKIRRRFSRFPLVGAMSRFFVFGKYLEVYQEFHSCLLDTINQNIDLILAVSNRVKEILVAGGIKNDLVLTSYIGTAVAEHQLGKCNTKLIQPFRIMYMGYMRVEKGFYFLLDALENTDESLAKNIEVYFVVRHDKNQNELWRIENLKKKFFNVHLINGYTHANQKELLSGINLGIVPVLWEDNLPQVAIEQVAYGVPILVSDLGGTQELCNNACFVFKGGDIEDFNKKLEYIYSHPNSLEEFWNDSKSLVTMNQHVEEIRNYYGFEQDEI